MIPGIVLQICVSAFVLVSCIVTMIDEPVVFTLIIPFDKSATMGFDSLIRDSSKGIRSKSTNPESGADPSSFKSGDNLSNDD